jgi:hypothetical protein
MSCNNSMGAKQHEHVLCLRPIHDEVHQRLCSLLLQVLTGIASSKQLTAKAEKGIAEAFAAV